MSVGEEYLQLSRMEVFERLEAVQLKRLILVSERYRLSAGEYLFRQHDPTDRVFAILEGEFSVLLEAEQGEEEITRLSQGELVGEMGAISGLPRMASIRAISESEVIGFESADFLTTVTHDPQTALKIMQMLSSRLALRFQHDEFKSD